MVRLISIITTIVFSFGLGYFICWEGIFSSYNRPYNKLYLQLAIELGDGNIENVKDILVRISGLPFVMDGESRVKHVEILERTAEMLQLNEWNKDEFDQLFH